MRKFPYSLCRQREAVIDLMAPPQVEIAKNLRPPRRVHCLKLLARDEAGDNGAKFEEERFSLFFGEREGEREREREREREEQEREK